MPEPLNIVEILERSEQGITRPFLCRCDDDRLYYVKGRSAGPRSLLCEWLAGHLALALGLPVPDFAVVQAPQALLALHPEGSDLGAMPAFGSARVESAQELAISHLGDVDVPLQRDVLAFDWWVCNQDRRLTAHGGNPNLLWDTAHKQLVVIDHNVAFDREFSTAGFSTEHVFSAQVPHVFQDLVEQIRYRERLCEALAVWPDACKNVPTQWWFVDEERTVPADFDSAAELALLNRRTTEEFWRLPP